MRSKFLIVHLKTIIVISVSIILTGLSLWAVAAASSTPAPIGDGTYTVVLDAGHGGFDAGVTGVNGAREADLNLIYSSKIAALLRAAGVTVIETRVDGSGLYGAAIKNRKQKDMEERKRIIEEAQPNLVISIHMNAFPQSSQRGAQVFYRKSLDGAKTLAETIQNTLAKNIEHCDRTALAADYYILNRTNYPSALIECGFLSNAQEEALLQTPEYQTTLSYHIYTAIMYTLYQQT